MARQLWCSYFNADASTVIHFSSLLKHATEKSFVCDCLQNDRKFAAITKCKFVKEYFFLQTYHKYIFSTALAINWFSDAISVLVLTMKMLTII